MKSSRVVTSCALAAILLLTSCSGSVDGEGEYTQSNTGVAAGRPSESPTSHGSNGPAAFSNPELEAKVAALSDALGDPLQPVAYEEVAADMGSTQAALEIAQIEPVACKSMVTDNVALARSKAMGGAMGMGAADEFGTVLLAVVLEARG